MGTIRSKLSGIVSNVVTWAADAGVRAVKTFGQATVGYLGVQATNGAHADWSAALQVGLYAGAASLLNNLATLKINDAAAAQTVVAQFPVVTVTGSSPAEDAGPQHVSGADLDDDTPDTVPAETPPGA